MNTTASVIIFDLGGVFLDFDYGIAARKIAARGDVAPAQVRQLIDHSPLLRRYESAQITTAEFFAEVCAATGFRGTLAEFDECFNSIFTLVEPMLALHSDVRRKKVPTFLLSNTSELAYDYIMRHWSFPDLFDGRVLSHEVGAMKPQPEIYQAAEKLCGRKGAEILFLDDRADNIAAAAARGWQVIHHQNPTLTRLAMEKLGVL